MAVLKFTTEKEYSGYMKINSCGQQWLTERDYNTIRENGRVDYSIHYIARGRGCCEFGGKQETIEEGSLVLYFPKVRHHYFFHKEDKTRMLWSHFSGTACSCLKNLRSDKPVILKIDDRKQFELVFEKMITAHWRRMTDGDLLCDSYMPVLLALICQQCAGENSKGSINGNEQMEKVLSCMHVEFNKPINIRKYAQMCFLSEDRFIRMFKKRTGFPPYHYQLKIRIQRAVEMLENSSVTVGECAEVVGFHDIAYFSRIFKKFTGYPPSFYKS